MRALMTASRRISLLGTALGLSFVATTAPALADNPAELLGALDDVAFAPLVVPDDRPAAFTVDVAIDAELRQLDLVRVSVWAPDAFVKVYRENGVVDQIAPPTPNTYRGTVRGVPGSVVTAGLKHDGLHAIVRLPDTDVYSIAPLDGMGVHAVYRAADFNEAPMQCDEPTEFGPGAGAGVGPGAHGAREHHGHGEPAMGSGSTHVAELALDCDVEYFNWNGSVENTLEEMALVINNVNEAYERDTNISHILTTAIVRTAEPDPYSSEEGFVINNEQVTEWTTNQTGVAYDVVLMFTNKDTWFCSTDSMPNACPSNPDRFQALGLVGRARSIGAVCDRTRAFCYTEALINDTTQAQVAAHELGHVWDGRHCDNDPGSGCIDVGDCLLMCSSINQCDNSGNVEFGPCNAQRVMDRRDTLDCLEAGTTEIQWVEWRDCGVCIENGTFRRPHNTLAEAAADVLHGGTVIMRTGSSSQSDGDETYPLTINKAMFLRTFNGPATIGN